MMAADTTVLDRVREAVERAQAAGVPAPSRATLAEIAGTNEYRVRKALATLERAGEEKSPAFASSSPAVASVADPADRGSVGSVEVAPAGERLATAGGDLSPAGDALVTAGDTVASRPAGGGKLVAWTGFLFGSAVSIAANVLASRIAPDGAPAGWEPSIYAQVGAAVWPLGLLLSVEVLSRVRWPSGVLWNIARYGGAGAVALGSAVISYGHIRDVLHSWGYSPLGAGVGPVVIDGLMTICGFAMLATSAKGAGGVR